MNPSTEPTRYCHKLRHAATMKVRSTTPVQAGNTSSARSTASSRASPNAKVWLSGRVSASLARSVNRISMRRVWARRSSWCIAGLDFGTRTRCSMCPSAEARAPQMHKCSAADSSSLLTNGWEASSNRPANPLRSAPRSVLGPSTVLLPSVASRPIANSEATYGPQKPHSACAYAPSAERASRSAPLVTRGARWSEP